MIMTKINNFLCFYNLQSCAKNMEKTAQVKEKLRPQAKH